MGELFCDWSIRSYSQEGEDVILSRIFEAAGTGFYVDVGAHHPKRFSNTYLFYRRGWRGINIDATPGSMRAFRLSRPEDTNLELAIAGEREEMEFFLFNEPALNTLDETVARATEGVRYRVIGRSLVPARPLADVLREHMAPGQAISFMSVDVEGREVDVLQSNDWERYRPQYLLVEVREVDIPGLMDSEVHRFLRCQNYQLFAKTMNTAFYRDGTTQ